MNRSSHLKWLLRVAGSAALASLLGLVSFAGEARADDPPPHTPPPEAYTACDGHADGDACTVTFREMTLQGTCAMRPGDTRLACRPNHPHGPPPPEAFTACEGHAEGAACSVTFRDMTFPGTCASHPGDTRLACRPNHPPPHPPQS